MAQGLRRRVSRRGTSPQAGLAHPWRDGAILAAVLVDVWFLLTVAPTLLPGGDAVSWWTINLADPYGQAAQSMTGFGAFRYSPVVAQAFAPFAQMSWPAFLALFLAIQLVAVVAMAGRRWPLVILFPPVLLNLMAGNVDLLMGAAIVAGFRWPGAWAFLLLTKVTPGVGVLWFLFRREWRSFFVAIGSTLGIAAISFVLAPQLWSQWFSALRAMAGLPQSDLVPPLLVRLPLAVVVVAIAARTDRRWLLPVACLIAVPNPWIVTLAILGASIALWPQDRPGMARPPGATATRVPGAAEPIAPAIESPDPVLFSTRDHPRSRQGACLSGPH